MLRHRRKGAIVVQIDGQDSSICDLYRSITGLRPRWIVVRAENILEAKRRSLFDTPTPNGINTFLWSVTKLGAPLVDSLDIGEQVNNGTGYREGSSAWRSVVSSKLVRQWSQCVDAPEDTGTSSLVNRLGAPSQRDLMVGCHIILVNTDRFPVNDEQIKLHLEKLLDATFAVQDISELVTYHCDDASRRTADGVLVLGLGRSSRNKAVRDVLRSISTAKFIAVGRKCDRDAVLTKIENKARENMTKRFTTLAGMREKEPNKGFGARLTAALGPLSNLINGLEASPGRPTRSFINDLANLNRDESVRVQFFADVSPVTHLGWVLYSLGRLQEARGEYTEASQTQRAAVKNLKEHENKVFPYLTSCVWESLFWASKAQLDTDFGSSNLFDFGLYDDVADGARNLFLSQVELLQTVLMRPEGAAQRLRGLTAGVDDSPPDESDSRLVTIRDLFFALPMEFGPLKEAMKRGRGGDDWIWETTEDLRVIDVFFRGLNDAIENMLDVGNALLGAVEGHAAYVTRRRHSPTRGSTEHVVDQITEIVLTAFNTNEENQAEKGGKLVRSIAREAWLKWLPGLLWLKGVTCTRLQQAFEKELEEVCKTESYSSLVVKEILTELRSRALDLVQTTSRHQIMIGANNVTVLMILDVAKHLIPGIQESNRHQVTFDTFVHAFNDICFSATCHLQATPGSTNIAPVCVLAPSTRYIAKEWAVRTLGWWSTLQPGQVRQDAIALLRGAAHAIKIFLSGFLCNWRAEGMGGYGNPYLLNKRQEKLRCAPLGMASFCFQSSSQKPLSTSSGMWVLAAIRCLGTLSRIYKILCQETSGIETIAAETDYVMALVAIVNLVAGETTPTEHSETCCTERKSSDILREAVLAVHRGGSALPWPKRIPPMQWGVPLPVSAIYLNATRYSWSERSRANYRIHRTNYRCHRKFERGIPSILPESGAAVVVLPGIHKSDITKEVSSVPIPEVDGRYLCPHCLRDNVQRLEVVKKQISTLSMVKVLSTALGVSVSDLLISNLRADVEQKLLLERPWNSSGKHRSLLQSDWRDIGPCDYTYSLLLETDSYDDEDMKEAWDIKEGFIRSTSLGVPVWVLVVLCNPLPVNVRLVGATVSGFCHRSGKRINMDDDLPDYHDRGKGTIDMRPGETRRELMKFTPNVPGTVEITGITFNLVILEKPTSESADIRGCTQIHCGGKPRARLRADSSLEGMIWGGARVTRSNEFKGLHASEIISTDPCVRSNDTFLNSVLQKYGNNADSYLAPHGPTSPLMYHVDRRLTLEADNKPLIRFWITNLPGILTLSDSARIRVKLFPEPSYTKVRRYGIITEPNDMVRIRVAVNGDKQYHNMSKEAGVFYNTEALESDSALGSLLHAMVVRVPKDMPLNSMDLGIISYRMIAIIETMDGRLAMNFSYGQFLCQANSNGTSGIEQVV